MPWPLYPQGKSPWYPLDRRLSGPQNRSEHGGEEKNSEFLPGLEPPIIHILIVFTRSLELFKLLITPIKGSEYRRVYPKVPGLAAWSENYKWYSSLPLGAVVSLFCESFYSVLPP
jgi:hypothetical protein